MPTDPLRLTESITRRDFLNATLLASGAAAFASMSPAELLAQAAAQGPDWTGPGGIGDYANSNGNTLAVLTEGHKIRDRVFQSLPAETIDTGETYDCVVIGGGISGLAAALVFKRRTRPGLTCLVLDNHPIFGGEAKRNEFDVDGRRLIAHQGSAFYFVPYPYSFIGRFYESIGLAQPRLTYQTWSGGGAPLAVSNTPYGSPGMDRGQYGLFFGKRFGQTPGVWAIDPVRKNLDGAPLAADRKLEVLRVLRGETKPGFQRPQYDGDTISRQLDTMTLEAHLMDRYGATQDTVRTFLADEGGGFGLGPDALSAFTLYAPDLLHPLDDPEPEQMFADGNGTFARLIVKTLLPDAITGTPSLEDVTRGAVQFAALDRAGGTTRIRLNATAVFVQHDGTIEKSETVTIGYTRDGRLYRVKARAVVMAGGSWTAKHILRDLGPAQRDAYAQFYRSPAVMINVALRNWRFLERMGISGCRWFDGVGSFFQIRRVPTAGASSATISPDQPIVVNLKVIFPTPGLPTEQQGQLGRARMLATSFRDYETQIRQQFVDMFGSAGFDPRDIAGIILNRWGHAYVSPQPGWYYGTDGKPAPRDVLRALPSAASLSRTPTCPATWTIEARSSKPIGP